MLFDPGRIKRGLASLAEAGPAIEAGQSYTLVIDRDWLDGRGAPLAEEFRKTVPRRAPPTACRPIPKKWRVTAPRAGTIGPLVIAFPKPLDYALLQHEIEVTGVAGKVAVARDETEWRFTPDAPGTRALTPSSSAPRWKIWPATTSTAPSTWTRSTPSRERSPPRP